MIFHRIEKDTWSRQAYYEHYMNQVRCTFSMTATVDITRLVAEVKTRGIKLYPALIHMLARVVNGHRELRTCLDAEGQLGYWEQLWPAYTVFHEEDKTFSSIWTSYTESFTAFYQQYLEDLRLYGDVRRLHAKPDEPPHTFPVSSIPWVNFTSFNLDVFNNGLFLLPIFTTGQYKQQNGEVHLPVAVQLHHAVCDGYHAGVVYRELQQAADQCGLWLGQ